MRSSIKGPVCQEAEFADKQRFRRAGLEPFLAHLNDRVARLSRSEPLYGPTREATARVVVDTARPYSRRPATRPA
jgi:hypothetical protein